MWYPSVDSAINRDMGIDDYADRLTEWRSAGRKFPLRNSSGMLEDWRDLPQEHTTRDVAGWRAIDRAV